MIPAAFDYLEAESVEHAVSLLGEHGDEAKLMAGGHSLLPLMKLRLATPSVIVDVGRLTGLSYVEDRGDSLAVGALTRHRDIERSPMVADHLPLLSHAAGLVGDQQVRNRGTIGGSLVHGDPASDLPSVALAAGATLVLEGPGGRREVPASEFFTGFLETATSPVELLVEVRFPKRTGVPWAFEKFNRRAQDWAIVGVAALLGDDPGVGLVNMGPTPTIASGVVEALRAGADPAEAASRAPEGTEAVSDLHADRSYRERLAVVLTERALRAASA